MVNTDRRKISNDRLMQNSLKKYGAKPVNASKKRKRYSKKKVKEKLKKFIYIAMSVSLMVHVANLGIDHIQRERELSNANDYMNVKIITYLQKAEVDYVILSDKSVVLLENDLDKLENLYNIIQDDGFERDEAIYSISKTCGEEAFDKIVKVRGYDDKEDFLYNNYVKGDLSSGGTFYHWKEGSEKVFENCIQEGYVENVKRIQNESAEKINGIKKGI